MERRIDQSALRLDEVTKDYGVGERAVRALDGVSFSLGSGSFTAIMGPSGSGKSTLLNCAAGLEHPTSGTVHVGGTPLQGRDEDELAVFRRTRIGFVFQGFNLLPYLTAEQNVALPGRLARRRVKAARSRELLDNVGLKDRYGHLPAEMSGGEQQRVSIARAQVLEPAVLFADEPTGALDSRSARQVLGLLRGSVDRQGQTIVMVTHDPVAAAYADVVMFLLDGRIVGRLPNPTADVVATQMAHLDELAQGGRTSVAAGAGTEAGR
ncbi:ABC transporter ATP-binding protein [Phytoactinopolyspora limicola]|uniref:ABC transporter ATP-binding protein n=1 Tax=Phytoactinopolyspora limicola TaxID=2715536 RepID=UPI001A9C338F|nr:ABC transporter ATP-binding protein [Phytoactinopolyspora limicola]